MIGFAKKYFEFIARLFKKQIPGEGLAFFRITYAIVLMCEIGHLIYYRHLIFDRTPYLEVYELDSFLPVFLAWEVLLSLLLIGAFTRTVTIANYVLTLAFFSVMSTFEYHVMYVYTGVNFLLMFLDVSRCYSFDRLWIQLKYSSTRERYIPSNTVSQLHYLVIPFMALGFVYFDSVFYKSCSPLWMKGMGMWLPASLPFVVHVDSTWMLNQKWLVLGLGYLTLVFETVFIFLFWHRLARVPLLIVGVGLHAGIVLQFPIPLFGLAVLAAYLTMVPVSCWAILRDFVHRKEPKLRVYMDSECPLCLRTRIILESFDITKAIVFKSVQEDATQEEELNDVSQGELIANLYSVDSFGAVRNGYETYIKIFQVIPYLIPLALLMRIPPVSTFGRKLYAYIAAMRETERCTTETCDIPLRRVPPANFNDLRLLAGLQVRDLKVFCWCLFLVFAVALQANVLQRSLLGHSVIRSAKLDAVGLGYVSRLARFSKIAFGITSHPVFMDSHFRGYNSIVGMEWEPDVGERIWLPIIDQRGMPGAYNYGANWVCWTFRTSGPNLDFDKFEERVEKWLVFWAYKNDVDLSAGKFIFHVKNVEIPEQWEVDFLKKQLAKPWKKVGEARWEGDSFLFDFSRSNSSAVISE